MWLNVLAYCTESCIKTGLPPHAVVYYLPCCAFNVFERDSAAQVCKFYQAQAAAQVFDATQYTHIPVYKFQHCATDNHFQQDNQIDQA